MSYDKRRRNCDTCGKVTQAAKTCLPCQDAARDLVRPAPRPCLECGVVPTRSIAGLCRRCQRADRRSARTCGSCRMPHYSRVSHLCMGCRDPEVALTGGAWIRRGLVWVWGPVDDRYSMSALQVMLEAAKNKATRTADCANSRLWSGSSHPHSAKNGSD